jgi:hypothetical protein
MCKSVMLHNVTTEKGHIKVMTVGEKYLCPGCNSTITTVGTGKGPNAAHNEDSPSTLVLAGRLPSCSFLSANYPPSRAVYSGGR